MLFHLFELLGVAEEINKLQREAKTILLAKASEGSDSGSVQSKQPEPKPNGTRCAPVLGPAQWVYMYYRVLVVRNQ